ncbi:hypothetical protein CROQUDRAFT_90233 [Cronartium quercuum f. sp. fusiforme G11]|uniref:Uncharacterized protein n=1 Tax=Cronartium quercuum f. sp. fusiforme G11 TaxID=708437 RepID=A0A9P6NM25_9BASI|nr:hypothetical protein CROQUDRAFT_90233 [Cronartium quercuum f. sp. fusiforme G11]
MTAFFIGTRDWAARPNPVGLSGAVLAKQNPFHLKSDWISHLQHLLAGEGTVFYMNPAQKSRGSDSLVQGTDRSASISHARVEEITAQTFRSTLDPVEKVFKNDKRYKSKLNKSINPDEPVAYGATILTGQTSEQTLDVVLLDVAPLSLDVAMQGNVFGAVVPRNTPILTHKFRTSTAVKENQYEGERVIFEDNRLLGKFELHDHLNLETQSVDLSAGRAHARHRGPQDDLQAVVVEGKQAVFSHSVFHVAA